MIEVRQTSAFRDWFANLRDIRAQARIRVRIDRIELGLLGGDKRSQQRDIKRAIDMAKEV
jgi:putative component of toxin-antitoxin plasmid stabilization module